MLIPVHLIDPPQNNVRKIAVNPNDDWALAESIRTLGLITPILVEQDGDRFRIIAGARRYHAAIVAGLTEVPAEIAPVTSPEHVAAVQVAENMVRTAMNPVDQWRALAMLTDNGFGLAAAATALGMAERHARKLSKLGRLHPTILEAIIQDPEDLPDERDLGAIASASLDVQEAAVRATRRGDEAISFCDVARECRKSSKRITASDALFDVEKSFIFFDEDLFAQPGSPDQFTTADIDGFLVEQKKALADLIKRKKSAQWKLGNAVVQNGVVVDARCPDGYKLKWTTGAQPSFPKGDKTIVHAFVVDDGPEIGRVKYSVFEPIPTKATGQSRPAETVDEAADDASLPSVDTAEGITAKGKELIARFKTEALRARLREPVSVNDHGTKFNHAFYLRMMILAFGANTVCVQFGESGHHVGEPSYKFRDLAAIVQHAADEELCEIAGELLARVLTIAVPGTRYGAPETVDPIPEWIGYEVGAAEALPRFDTAEFLATLNGERLRAVAELYDIKPPKNVKELRKRLEGHLPDWRPCGYAAPVIIGEPAEDDDPDGEIGGEEDDAL